MTSIGERLESRQRLELQRERLSEKSVWIAAQRTSLEEIEAALDEAKAAVAIAIEARATADALWTECDELALDLGGDSRAPIIH